MSTYAAAKCGRVWSLARRGVGLRVLTSGSDARRANLFFQLVAARYTRGSLLITSNVPFDDWGKLFGGTKPRRVPRRLTDPATRRSSLTARIRFLVNAFRWSTGSAPAGAIMCSCNCRVGCGVRFL